ncbi:hypothetical protein SAMN04489760_10174 [Syntrophus gentianae]|uniref:Uncharacterized protein n=1 Tax=Syntrophus gentianae TaxID=43775 RepID=A0A1H7UBI5_9BACT|nr:hypothetical protein [Syntrophus gentianae]SEL94104.1 hypothetical protein SAMN04489760_10174 [Syntrophus gentianae]
MATEKGQTTGSKRIKGFLIEGRIQREQPECQPGELKLAVYVFDKAGALLGTAGLNEEGLYKVAVRLSQPADVDLIVGPADMPQEIRISSAFRKSFSAREWKGEGQQYHLQYEAFLPLDIWRPWWPVRICISGHVRKVSESDGVTNICPVPFVKVEIFDVDRENCFWPPLRKWWELLLDRPVIRIPELLKEPPVLVKPFPGPDPAPELKLTPISKLAGGIGASRLGLASLGPQPEPPDIPSAAFTPSVKTISSLTEAASTALQPAFTRVGEARLMDSSIAARLDKLTLTSKIPPWLIFPFCFYSKAEVCETTTDCDGFFNCCFKWWPFHFRRGRLRFDARPDIILKVTQVIDGVPTVVYLDPYTSTRWNVNNAHIDLFLDNEEVICGNGNCYEPPDGSPVFFTRIGDDEVYKINQTSGLYNEAPLTNVAYGGSLLVYGQFGDALTTGAPARYYRLSYAIEGSSEFVPVTTTLGDTRVAKSTLFSETYTLGPKTINGVPALYEVRNFSDYYWYNPDWIGTWYSWLAEADTGKYVLRLEVFDENGAKLTTAMGVDYRDGTVTPPAVLPPMLDRCDLVITLDNKPPQVDLTIPAVINECGVIPWTPALSLTFQVQVSQENNRLRSWGLYYTKGVNPTIHYLDSGVSNNGLPGSVNKPVSGGTAAPAPGTGMLAGLDTTCAFALKLWAYAHVRDGRHFIYYREQIKAIAVEKCPPCPE